MTALVRPSRPSDATAAQAVLRDTFETTWGPQITPEAMAAYRAHDRPKTYWDDRGAQFWLAEVGGEVVGLVDWDGDFVNALHVRSSHARKGIGSALMDHAEAAIAAAGLAAVRLETDTFNTRSRAFYAGRGFVEVDRYPDREWNSGLTTLLLSKPLNR